VCTSNTQFQKRVNVIAIQHVDRAPVVWCGERNTYESFHLPAFENLLNQSVQCEYKSLQKSDITQTIWSLKKHIEQTITAPKEFVLPGDSDSSSPPQLAARQSSRFKSASNSTSKGKGGAAKERAQTRKGQPRGKQTRSTGSNHTKRHKSVSSEASCDTQTTGKAINTVS
jgi:hypothetical protein